MVCHRSCSLKCLTPMCTPGIKHVTSACVLYRGQIQGNQFATNILVPRKTSRHQHVLDLNARLYSSGTYLNTTRGLTPDHHAVVRSKFPAAANVLHLQRTQPIACFPPKHAWSMRASPTSTYQTSTPPPPPSTHSLTPNVRPVLLRYLRHCQHITTIVILITNTVIITMVRTVPTWFSLLMAASAFTLSAGNLEYKVNRLSVF